MSDADVIVIGGGRPGLVATGDLIGAGRRLEGTFLGGCDFFGPAAGRAAAAGVA